jgi:hypothetical protein
MVNKKENGNKNWTNGNREKFFATRHFLITNMEFGKYDKQKTIFLATDASDHAVG